MNTKLFRIIPYMLVVSLGMPSTLYWTYVLTSSLLIPNLGFFCLLTATLFFIHQRGGFHHLWTIFKDIRLLPGEPNILWFFKIWFGMVVLHVFNGVIINLFILNLILTDLLQCLF